MPNQTVVPGVASLIGVLKGAIFNTTADQAITLSLPTGISKYVISSIMMTNASTALTTAVGGIYNTTSKGGTDIVANTQTYTTIVAPPTGLLYLTRTNAGAYTVFSNATLYLSLTTPQGAAATADIYVYGTPVV